MSAVKTFLPSLSFNYPGNRIQPNKLINHHTVQPASHSMIFTRKFTFYATLAKFATCSSRQPITLCDPATISTVTATSFLRFVLFITSSGSRNSSVGIAFRYGLDGPGIEWRYRRDFPHPSKSAPQGPTQLPVQCTASFPWIKRPGRGVNLPSPSSAEVKENVEVYLYHHPLWAFTAGSRANFTFLSYPHRQLTQTFIISISYHPPPPIFSSQ
jgi:hypothetical protein